MARAGRTFKLLLINPGRRRRFQWDMKEVCQLMGKKTTAHPLALPLIAALTPERYQVRIADEEMAPLSLGERPDLVGITALHSNVTRGYELADLFRAMGVPVVMGGPQVSFHLERSLHHCDAVVVGEAEGVWERLLEDFERGALRQVYQAESPCEFRRSPMPRWDLVDTRLMMTTPIQVSRGCPNRCRFCCVSKLFGATQRYREVDDVIAEVEAAPVKEIAFADDNLMADGAFARELLEKLIPLGVSFSCQSSLEVGLDLEMVDLMARAGCRTILFGFESVNQENLDEAGKVSNVVERYEEIIENVHRAGIHVLGSFLVGFEADTIETFDRIEAFIGRNRLSFVMVNSMSPFRGTALHRSLERSGRLIPMDVDELVLFYPMMRYRHLEPDELARRGLELLRRVYSCESLLEKGPAILGNGAFRHEDSTGLSATTKIRASANLLRSHLGPSADHHKRRLFLELFRLIREGQAAPGDVVRYLLFMSSQQGFLDYAEANMDHAIDHIRQSMAAAE